VTTMQDLKNEHGDLITLKELAQVLGVGKKFLTQYVRSGFFDQWAIKFEESYAKKYLKGYRYLFKAKHIDDMIQDFQDRGLKKDSLDKDKSLISDYAFARMCGVDVQTIRSNIETGEWIDLVVDAHHGADTVIYYLRRDEIWNRIKYKPLLAIKNLLKVHCDTLYRLEREGLIQHPKGYENTNLYDPEHIEQVLMNIRANRHKKIIERAQEQDSSYKLLPDSLQTVIDEYIDYRRTFQMQAFGHTFKPITENTKAHVELSRILYIICCGRCGASFDINYKGTDRLPDDVFTIWDIDKKDVALLKMKTGWKQSTVQTKFYALKPFLIYLMKEAAKSQFKGKKLDNIREKLQDLIEALPIAEVERETSFTEHRLVLSREQVIRVYQMIYRITPNRFNALKYASMWMIGTFAGLRPEEMIKLRLAHFIRNKDGFLWTDEEGFGLLNLPRKYSKQQKFPTYTKYGTVLVPRLVKQIDLYLTELYRYHNPNEDGWLIRPVLKLPETRYYAVPQKFIGKIRDAKPDFIDELRLDQFVLKTSRRSMNNLIVESHLKEARLRGDKQKWTGQVQMRHHITASTSDLFYRDALPVEDFRRIINDTLNYPWNLDELKAWEIQMGYNIAGDSTTYYQGESDTQRIDVRTDQRYELLRKEIHQKRQAMEQLKTRPSDMEVVAWLNARNELKEKINLLEARLIDAQ